MSVKTYAAAAAIGALLLAGCEQRQTTTSAAEPPMRTSAASSASTSTTDPSLPPAESASTSKPDQDAAVTLYSGTQPNPAPSAQTGRDATPDSALTPVERDREMPMKGQANDYNTPDRAKEGDQPNTASKEPGGQEANAGNLTGGTKEAKP
jgi:hypothetical protein